MTSSRSRTLFVAALGFATLANVLFLVDTPPTSFPFRPHADPALPHLVETEQRSLEEQFGFYLDLNEVAAGRTLVVDRETVDPILVDGIADMHLIEDQPDEMLDPAVLLSLEGSEGVTRLGDDGPLLEYVVVAPDPSEVRIRLVQTDGTLFAVGERRLNELIAP